MGVGAVCDIDAGDYESWRAWSETPRKARKEHRCDACGVTIAVGEPYLVHSHVGEGTAETEKACFACWWARKVFSSAHGVTYAPSYLKTSLMECIDLDGDREWRPLLAGVLRRERRARRAKENRDE